MNCPNCQKEIPETAKVCGFCGMKQIPPEPVAPPPVAKPREVATAPVEVETTPKNAPGRKKSFPVWLIGLIVVVVIAGAYFVLRNLGGPAAASPGSGSQPEPASQQPAAESYLPDPVYDYIRNPKVEMHDTFDDRNEDFWDSNHTNFNDGTATLMGTGDWETSLVSKQEFWKEEAVLLRIAITEESEFGAAFYNGEVFQTPNFKQFELYANRLDGIFLGERLEGDTSSPAENFETDTILPGQWYYLLMMIEGDHFRWAIWPVDDPGQITEFEAVYPDDWESERFLLSVHNNQGKFAIADFYWIKF